MERREREEEKKRSTYLQCKHGAKQGHPVDSAPTTTPTRSRVGGLCVSWWDGANRPLPLLLHITLFPWTPRVGGLPVQPILHRQGRPSSLALLSPLLARPPHVASFCLLLFCCCCLFFFVHQPSDKNLVARQLNATQRVANLSSSPQKIHFNKLCIFCVYVCM